MHFDKPVTEGSAAKLNTDCRSLVDRDALEQALRTQGDNFLRHVTEHCPHLFAAVPFFVSVAQVEQMKAVIAAVDNVVKLPAWREHLRGVREPKRSCTKGVFFGYDFHLNAEGAHLIEINSNAGGAFLCDLLLQSQRDVLLPGVAAVADNLQQVFLDMFRNEWRLERGAVPLQTVVIVDEQPQQQYLYPEFLLAQRMFERAGMIAMIADPTELDVRCDGLYCHGRKVDLVYNRLTDFFLHRHAALSAVFQNSELAVMTPHPLAYALYADKYNLTRLTHVESLRAMGAADADITVLQAGIPQTRIVLAEDQELWRQQRKQWFFKPVNGFASRGTYRGANVTHRVFAEIMQGGYVAQRMAPPSERTVWVGEAEPVALKSDVRCYVYDGQVQLIVARLYQGQTTNLRTENGGFAQVRMVE